MKAITDIKERQKIALDILLFFRDFCDKNDIQFFLAYGTLLGAVRHKGFIPWDDDVDIMMTRAEYKKLLACLNKLDHPYYKFLSMHNNEKYFAPLAKMYDDRTLLIQGYGQDEKVEYGIYVDVFIIDNLPDGYNEAEKLYKKSQRIRGQWGLSVRKLSVRSSSWLHYIVRVPVSLVYKALGYKYYLKKYDQLASSLENEDSNHAGIIIYGEGLKKEYCEKSMFSNPSIVSFEGVEFNAPADVDTYLTQMYGNYMQLPPEDDRKVHPCKVYWK